MNRYAMKSCVARFIAVSLLSTILHGQELMICDPCSEAQFMVKRQARLNAEQGHHGEWSLSCDFNNPQDYQRKKEEGRVEAAASLVGNIIIFVETSYVETIKDSGGSVSETIISSIKTNTPRIPLTGLTYDYIKKDENTLLVYAYVSKKNVEEGADRINLAFDKANTRELKKFRYNVTSGNISGALENVAKIYAYSYSMVPFIGRLSGKSSIGQSITTELRNTVSGLNLKLLSPREMLEGIPYLSSAERDLQIVASYNGKPVSGLPLRARMVDGLSDWDDNIYTLKPTNNRGQASFRLGRILSKQTVQRILVELNFEALRRDLEKVSDLRAFLNPEWYSDFREGLKKTGFESLGIQIQVDSHFEIYIPFGNIRAQAGTGMGNSTVKRDFEQALMSKKGIKLVSKSGENTLALRVDIDLDSKTGRHIILTTSLVNRKQEPRAKHESRIRVGSKLEWNSEVREHVVALLDNLDKGDVRLTGDNGIKISIDGGKPRQTIKGGIADVRLSYGAHSFSFSKLGFWQRDTTITVYQPLHEFPVELQKKDIQVVLGLPYPERDFNLQIRSENKKRSKYTLNFEGNQLSYSLPERIYRNNIIHLPEDGNYAFTFKTKGKKNDTIKRPLDGKRPFYHEINFEPFSFSEIGRNALLPGLNQLKMNYSLSGVLFIASAVATAYYTISWHNKSMEYLDQYRQAKVAYEDVFDAEQDIFDMHRIDAEEKYDFYNQYRNWSLASGSGLSVVAVSSFIHAVWVFNLGK